MHITTFPADKSMTLLLLRLPRRSSESSPWKKRVESHPESQRQSVQQQQVLEHLREVRAVYRLERRNFF
jgi:hypothetical protein